MQESRGTAFFREGVLSPRVSNLKRSPMEDALSLSLEKDIILLSLGLPSPELLPLDEFVAACAQLLGRGPTSLQYGTPSQALKSHVLSLMKSRGVDCVEDQIFLTSGAQQGLALIVPLLLAPRQPIIVEELCYPGFQQVIELFEPEILTVSTDPRTGMDVDKVEWLLSHGPRPAFIYAIPDGHNPLGVSLSEEKRVRLADLSRKYSVPIIEEDPYGFLSYTLNPLKPLRAYFPEGILYVGSFSKIIAPSARLGWVVVPEAIGGLLATLKEASDINTITFTQHVVKEMLDSNFMASHLERIRIEYKKRRDKMLEALRDSFPDGTTWIVPTSGIFVWARLPAIFDTNHLLQIAVKRYRVAFMPGSAFYAGRRGIGADSSLRLNFSYPSITDILTGVGSLGQMFKSLPVQGSGPR